jgi:TatD DNase family protein
MNRRRSARVCGDVAAGLQAGRGETGETNVAAGLQPGREETGETNVAAGLQAGREGTPPLRAIDSHCHLADPAFASDLEAVVERAGAAGVKAALCILTAGDETELARARRVAQVWPAVRFAVGVHPHVAARYAGRPEAVVEAVEAALDAVPRVVAIGEIGLDYHYDFSPRDVQREVFRRQVRLARERGLPIVVHTRDAGEDTLGILRDVGEGVLRSVLHCFSGDAAFAEAAMAVGCAVSFAGLVTFPKADEVREAARVVPAERLLVETDAPYLAPVPRRGRRNEPGFVLHVIAALAELRRETPGAVAAATARTFEALFGSIETPGPLGSRSSSTAERT